MKGASETFSTILLTSVFIAMIAILIPYSYTTLTLNTQRTEYEYVKQVFQGVASQFPLIAIGGVYEATLPGYYTSRGYSLAGRIEVYLNSSSTPNITLTCTAVTSGVNIPGEPRGVIFGSADYIVNDTRLIPRILERRAENGLVISLDTCRLLVSADTVPSGNYTGYYYTLLFYNLSITGTSNSRNHVLVTPTGSPRIIYSDVSGKLWNMTIVVHDYLTGTTRQYSLIDVIYTAFGGYYAGTPFSIKVLVTDLTMEVK